ncbi:MAG: bile acid:sodium symporter [Lentisphaeraceae bacterium]|nr:bile acid:sodium symporter [Lentisphaeraceae bacterium]
MNKALEFIKKNNIIVAVVGATLLAIILPAPGQKLSQYNLISPLIILVFFCQGTGVTPIKSSQLKQYFKILMIGFITSQVAAPILGYACAKAFNWQADSFVGFILICAMAPTLVSGTIISEQAGGNRTASLIITIILNIAAVFTVPLILSYSLDKEVKLEVLPLLLKLVKLVLIPAVLGYLFRLKRESTVQKHKDFFKYLPIFLLAAVIYISMSLQVETIKQLTLSMLAEYTLGSIIVHLILLYACYYTCIAFKTDIASAKSTAICCSQKTIPITIAIWTAEFSTFSLALLPAIVFHLTQIYCDGMIAKKWIRSSS